MYEGEAVRVHQVIQKSYPWGVLLLALLLGACSAKHPQLPTTTGDARYSTQYLIGPGDSVEIFVWRNPDVSTTVPVRPDGLLTAPLLEDMPAAGKTPTELARDLERKLATYLRDPLVTVIVNGFVGTYNQQIRIVGEAAEPQALLYNDSMTALDVVIGVDGLTEFADGNKSIIIRFVEGKQQQFTVRLDDLIRDGDISANVDMQPGDILIIPEAWF
jgi:polysaccharide export outer membrane protein